jgi:hypothetical protein
MLDSARLRDAGEGQALRATKLGQAVNCTESSLAANKLREDADLPRKANATRGVAEDRPCELSIADVDGSFIRSFRSMCVGLTRRSQHQRPI